MALSKTGYFLTKVDGVGVPRERGNRAIVIVL